MPSLSEDDRTQILELARQSLRQAVCAHRLPTLIPTEGIFGTARGVFVSLHIAGKLRGCIGMVEPEEPLGRCIAHCAASAALQDPRFAPMREEEVEFTEIEVSILSPLRKISPEEIEIGKHGLLIEHGVHRGLLLPQVATEHGLDRENFLDETCRKAGLPRGTWKKKETVILGFTCEIVASPEAN
jgi:AmmeMemoRadiSam system protein A